LTVFEQSAYPDFYVSANIDSAKMICNREIPTAVKASLLLWRMMR
jgi:hypothetical protein